MNERIKELALEARLSPALLLHHWGKVDALTDSEQEVLEQIEKFAELMTAEFIGLLEYEIAMLEKYKTTACNDFDRRWHEGKIVHFNKLIEKTKDHFGVEESRTQPDQEAAAFIAAENKKVASRYGYFPKLHPSEWQDK